MHSIFEAATILATFSRAVRWYSIGRSFAKPLSENGIPPPHELAPNTLHDVVVDVGSRSQSSNPSSQVARGLEPTCRRRSR